MLGRVAQHRREHVAKLDADRQERELFGLYMCKYLHISFFNVVYLIDL